MTKTEARGVKKLGFFERTSLYGFELFMALFGLVVTVIVVDYCLFALLNYAKNMGSAGQYMSEFTLWIIAAMIVWLPVTLVFYLRSRSEDARNPTHREGMLYRALTSLYYFCLIIGAIGLAFVAMYALIRMAISPDESVSDIVVRVVVPALLAVGVHCGMMFAYTKSHKPNRRVFAGIFGGLVAALALTLFVVSVGVIRTSSQDDRTMNDLSTIKMAIDTYSVERTTVPGSLSELKLTNDATMKRLKNYEYTKVADTRYELCADFAGDTTGIEAIAPPVTYQTATGSGEQADEYKTYGNFYVHKKGKECYKLQVSTDLYMDNPSSTVKPDKTDVNTEKMVY